MSVNDLVESSFVGVMAQVQAFGRIYLSCAAAVSDMSRNRFFLHDTPQTNDGKTGMFYNSPDELQLTAVIYIMEHTPDTRDRATSAL